MSRNELVSISIPRYKLCEDCGEAPKVFMSRYCGPCIRKRAIKKAKDFAKGK